MVQVLFRAVRNSPAIYSLYIGFEKDGNFTEVLRIPKGLTTFGPNRTALPPGAIYVLRVLQRPADDAAIDAYTYVDAQGVTLLTEQARLVSYDPRTRPFFKEAKAQPGKRVISELYGSASTGKTVLTLSRTFGVAQEVMGAVGANITLESMSDFLRRYAPGRHGLAMVLDENGKLIAHPDADMVARRVGADLVITHASELKEPQVQSALSGHRMSREIVRRIFKSSDGREYVAAFTPFPPDFAKKWELLIVVPTEDFVGEIKEMSRRVLLLGAVVLMAGVVGIRLLAHTFSRPIDQLIFENDRIRSFDLIGEIVIPSRVSEIINLTQSTGTMKTALRFLSGFVPKTLVRDLLSTG
ncbi:MAG: cache domain-containing protein, partial [Verrucomicrobiota bacterium]